MNEWSDPKNVVLFFREGHFYPVQFEKPKKCGKSLKEQAKTHAELNPGTERIETMDGKVLWRKTQCSDLT